MSNIEIDVNALSEAVNDKADRDLGNLTEEGDIKLGKGGIELCDIGMALYVDETKGLRRYLNGQIVDINTNTQAFLNRLLEIKNTNPELFTTESNWQSEALLNIDGCVYKFVLNYSGDNVVSVRLPKYPDYVEINAGGTLPVVGNGMTLGLTDGTHYAGLFKGISNTASVLSDSSGLYGKDLATPVSGSSILTYAVGAGVTTDPTKSGIETTLKQTKLKMRYFIQIATGSETENNIINDIELNNPFSLFECKYSDHELFNLSWLISNGSYNGSNAVHPSAYQALLVEHNAEVAIGSTVTLPSGINYTKQGISVKLSTETYTDYDFVINSANETFRPPIKPNNLNNTRYLIEKGEQDGISYRIYADGWCEQGGHYTINTNCKGTITFLKEFVDTSYTIFNSKESADSSAWNVMFDTLETWTTSQVGIKANLTGYTLGGSWKASGYLAEGEYTPITDNILLYYYVGETVQNANLIDAGRIGEQLATKTDMLQASGASMPSNKYIDLTLGASGTTYTAPANGWVYFSKFTTANNQYIALRKLKQNALEYSTNNFCPTANNGLNIIMPITEGQKFAVDYTAGGQGYFRFIYAEGAQ